MEKPHRMGFLGPAGTHSEAAALWLRGYLREADTDAPVRKLVPYPDIDDVLVAVERGEIDSGFVPVENSLEGAIRVTLDLPGALPPVLFDAGQVQQVFFNLVKNALEAMKDGGALAIAFDVTDDAVAISFRDTGSGIPAADLGRLFEPYRTTKGANGNGLGLMMCRRIVRAHGGEIDVASQEGHGTCFTVRLPRLEKRIRRLT